MIKNKNQSKNNSELSGSENTSTTTPSFFTISDSTGTDNAVFRLEDFRYYQIDYDKVNTLEDVKLLLKATSMAFSKQSQYFNEVKHLLKGVE